MLPTSSVYLTSNVVERMLIAVPAEIGSVVVSLEKELAVGQRNQGVCLEGVKFELTPEDQVMINYIYYYLYCP